jgi:AraC-like DNA-binding protein
MDGPALAPDFHDHRAGEQVALHAHEEGQVLLALEGAMDVQVGSAHFRLGPGSAVWVPPRLPHAALSVESTAFRGMLVGAGPSALLPLRPQRFAAQPILLAAVPDLTADRARRRALATALLIDELLTRVAIGALSSLPADDRLAALCARALADLAEAPDLTLAARTCGLSRRSFTRAFRASTGRGWATWVREARMAQAAALIADGTPVTDAALAVGYTTPSAFSVAFRRGTGIAPVALSPTRGVHQQALPR